MTKNRYIQTQARQDKAWQGMARPGEASRGKTRRRPDKKVSPGFERYGISWQKDTVYTGPDQIYTLSLVDCFDHRNAKRNIVSIHMVHVYLLHNLFGLELSYIMGAHNSLLTQCLTLVYNQPRSFIRLKSGVWLIGNMIMLPCMYWKPRLDVVGCFDPVWLLLWLYPGGGKSHMYFHFQAV